MQSLSEYQRIQDEKDSRHERVLARANRLMEKGEEFSPYGTREIKHFNNATKKIETLVTYNLFEALNEIKGDKQKEISDKWENWCDPAMMINEIDKLINEYWYKQALYRAEELED